MIARKFSCKKCRQIAVEHLLSVLPFFPLINPIAPWFGTVEWVEYVKFAAVSLDVEDEDEATV